MAIQERRVQEGYIPIGEYKVWYRSVGGGAEHEDTPLLTLHGGPGVPSYYLEDLQDLATEKRRVILYDQMGCGRSDRPDTPEFWTIDYFVQELGKVREALGLEKVHLWGHSWGGLLAIEYVLTQPQGLASLTLASTPNSIPLWVEEANRLRQELPADTQAILTQHEEAGTTDSEEYENAVRVFNSRYLIRCSAPSLGRASKESGKVYRVMNGPSEFHITGVLKDWDRIARLPDIQLPTLITSGRYDEATPKINEITHKAINNSEWVLFEKSAHMSHIEEKERYLATMASFLTRVEAPSHP